MRPVVNRGTETTEYKFHERAEFLSVITFFAGGVVLLVRAEGAFLIAVGLICMVANAIGYSNSRGKIKASHAQPDQIVASVQASTTKRI